MSSPSHYLEAIVLGTVQGVAEFLPISSSGHLVILSAVMDAATGREIDPEANRLLVVVLHLGTLGSILWAYRRDLWSVATSPRYVAAVVIATLPLVAVAFSPIKDLLQEAFDRPDFAGICLLVTAALLLAGQALANRPNDLSTTEDPSNPSDGGVSLPAAVAIGLFQSLALLPGISRSGSTIAGGLMSGVARADALRFSLMIGIPAIAGAGLLEAKSVFETGVSVSELPVGPLLVGAAVSFAVGVGAISLLKKAVSNDRLHWFAAYCAAVGTATLVWQAL
ncbi:undecaprenyl-diphosphate phosphatase [Alienimonas chondri]|uniref:Undecaprenyl-diphosphatase n=1 Tax=Alienimonas chondri TaxID=2681879 RepID=A0ABX1V9D5_9PLAN|nr:undecaprenyl-diphosphate phosphatase [Alienimonas chondri]NNJ24536.1 Undecaprenyl-diphosphatase [Alienimonas chondri]